MAQGDADNGGGWNQDTWNQMMGMYNSSQQANNAGSGEKTAGGVIGAVGGVASMIPGYGTAIGAGLGLVSGLLESDAASKQKDQAAADLAAAKAMKPAALSPRFREKTLADQMAATSDMPGWGQAHDLLLQDFATHLRAIHNNSLNGGQAVNAIALSLGLNNDSMSKLFAENAAYRGGVAKDARNDLWALGLQEHQGEQELYTNYQKPLFEQATALQNAGTANQHNAINTITGALSTGSAGVLGQVNKNQAWEQVMAYLKGGPQTPKGGLNANAGSDADNSYAPASGSQGNPLWDYSLGNYLGAAGYESAPTAQ